MPHIVLTDDPPIFLRYCISPSDKPPSDPKRLRRWLIHDVNLGIALKEKTDSLQLEAHLQDPGADCQDESLVNFFSAKLFAEFNLEVKCDGSEIYGALGRR